MQDENSTCCDLGKVSFERAVDSFPNAPTRARDSFSNVLVNLLSNQLVTRACDRN